jgi:hypothetical protein
MSDLPTASAYSYASGSVANVSNMPEPRLSRPDSATMIMRLNPTTITHEEKRQVQSRDTRAQRDAKHLAGRLAPINEVSLAENALLRAKLIAPHVASMPSSPQSS